MKKNNKGFTLVELIVVLVILAILAAILTPALLGYIDRARSEKDYSTAQTVRVAAQAVIDQAYGEGYEPDGSQPTIFKIENIDGVFESTNAYNDSTSTDTGRAAKYKKLVYTLASVTVPTSETGTTGVRSFKFAYKDGIITEGYVYIGTSYYVLGTDGTWEGKTLDTAPTVNDPSATT